MYQMHQLRPFAMWELQGHLSVTGLKDIIGNVLLESLLPGTSYKASFSKQSQRGRLSNVYEMLFSRGRSWGFRKRCSQSGWRERLDLDDWNSFMKATTGCFLNRVQRRSRVISRHQSTFERCQATSHRTQLLRHRSVPHLRGRRR